MLGLKRWVIEDFFKTIKRRFGLPCFGQSTKLGVYCWLILALLAYRLFRVCVVQINFEKACFTSFFKIYLGFEKAQSAVSFGSLDRSMVTSSCFGLEICLWFNSLCFIPLLSFGWNFSGISKLVPILLLVMALKLFSNPFPLKYLKEWCKI